MREVLSGAKDLPAYVEHLDSESARTGQDSPILRKAIGDTYRQRNDLANAITQYKLAIELQSNDKEIHQSLIACYDATNQGGLATSQLIKLIDLQHHDLSLFQQLATRLKDNEVEAERAATSIIESAPNESESHAAMAELRQNQNRWSEAIPHWEQVAKLRKLEPTGLLGLTAAQIHEKQWGAAKTSLNQLSRTEWPSRFNHVTNEIQQLEQQLPKP
jgi:tetratricopeptide (TPR) repeat protein